MSPHVTLCLLATILSFSIPPSDQSSVSDPLLLTPLLKAGKNLEAQAQSRVNSLLPGVDSGYSGFFTVDEAMESNLHFWFHPCDNCTDWKTQPVVLWIQGGCGLSAMRGAFQENLLAYNVTPEGDIQRLQYGLTHYVNVLLVDNTNVGFSHTNDETYVMENHHVLAEELYNVLTQFFLMFPELERKIYVGGLSNAGIKVGALSNRILDGTHKIDLGGVILGDGILDLEDDWSQIGEYYYNFGLIDKKLMRNISAVQENIHARVQTGENVFNLAIQMIFKENLNKHLGQRDFDLIDIMRAYRLTDHWLTYIQSLPVRDSLHVGRLAFSLSPPSGALLYPPMRCAHLFARLLNAGMPLLRFNGQYDGVIPYQGTVTALRGLQWRGQACLQTHRFDRRQVWLGGRLVGYVRQCHNLREMMFLRTSHVVQYFIPRTLWTMVNKFIEDSRAVDGSLYS